MGYQLIEAQTAAELSAKVSEFTRDGWLPVGNHTVTQFFLTDGELVWRFCQAVSIVHDSR